jgi:hydrogenase maturation protease
VVRRIMSKNRICLIACGNPTMGNDGAGLEVMRMFEGECAGIDCIEGGMGGIGLIPLMEGYEKVVIVDAMTGIGDRVGDIRIFETPPLGEPSVCALHEIGVGEAVALARELGMSAEVVTVGIEAGAVTEFCTEIDPAVKDGILVAYRYIRNIVERWTEEANTPV